MRASSGMTLFTQFNAGRDKVKDVFGMIQHVRKTMPGFSIQVTWPGENTEALGAATVYVGPPAQFKAVKAMFIVAKDDKDLIERVSGGVHRMLRDINSLESENAIGNAETTEYKERDRKRTGQTPSATAATVAAVAPKPERAKRGVRRVAAIG